MSTLSVLAAAAETPSRLALEQPSVRYTFADLACRVARRQEALQGLLADTTASGAGGLIALETSDVLGAIKTILALMELGLPFVPLHDRLTPSEKRAILERHPIRCVLEPSADGGLRCEVLRAWPDFRAPADALAAIATSGTTDAPRLAVLTRKAFVQSAQASAHNLGWRDDDRWLLCLPLAHVGGLSIVTRCLLGRRAIVLPDPAALRAGGTGLGGSLSALRPTLLSLVPTQLARLLEAGTRLPPGVRAILVGGAPATVALLEACRERGWPVLTSYGLTEACSQVATRAPAKALAGGAGCGRPLKGVELRFVDGVIELRGKQLFSGYLGEPASGPSAEGWYRTGDVGCLDAEGELHVLGRVDDVIISGGENVFPGEVESVLSRCPGVRAACAFGVPDARFGQVVAVALEAPGESPDAVREAVRGLIRRELSPFKRPRWVAVAPRLVLGHTGKLDRAATAAALTGALVRLS